MQPRNPEILLKRARTDKRGMLKPLTKHGAAAPADIWQLAGNAKQWLLHVQGTESLYYRAIGLAEAWLAPKHLAKPG